MDQHVPNFYGEFPYQVEQDSAFARLRPQAFPANDSLTDGDMAFIDPVLHSLETLEYASRGYGEPSTVDRFLQEPSKTAFFDHRLPADSLDTQSAFRPGSAHYLTTYTPSHARLGSPISSLHPTTISNAALSPLTEPPLDFTPASPDSDSLMSPSQPDIRGDPWLMRTFGTAASYDLGAYVNPAEVNVTQEPPLFDNLDGDTGDLDIRPLSRHPTFGSDIVRDELEAVERIFPSEDHRSTHHTVNIRQDQVHVQDTIEACVYARDYPSPLEDDVDEDREPQQVQPGARSAMKRARRQASQDDEDDEDYSPRKRQNARTSPVTPRRGVKIERDNTVSNIKPATRQSGRRKAQPSASAAIARSSVTVARPHGLLACTQCAQDHFRDEASLESHVKKQHRRPFICVFHFAGCESTFASKNEWKRHVMSQHLRLEYWLCTEGGCDKSNDRATPSTRRPASGSRRGAPAPVAANVVTPFTPDHLSGNDFGRKDLHAQHLRRMHMPKHIEQQIEELHRSDKKANTTPEWNDMLADFQAKAHRTRCLLPTYMTCPLLGCQADFVGDDAWDHRMEHVAKHLEQAAIGKGGPVEFGGTNDHTLIQWAARPDVAVIKQTENGRWVQNNPLKDHGAVRSVPRHVAHDHELDAEGEDDDYFAAE